MGLYEDIMRLLLILVIYFDYVAEETFIIVY